MNVWQAMLLGVIQGITEFFPISSSGHLKIGQWFFGFEGFEHYVLFDLICHLGTLLAILILFYREIVALFSTKRSQLQQLALAILPLFAIVAIKKPLEALSHSPDYLGLFFLITSFLLWLGIRFGHTLPTETLAKKRWKDALVIGSMQTVALLPGVSRSGSTISVARMLGWTKEEALSFSFLLAIPTILGGMCYETLSLLSKPASSMPQIALSCYAAGFIASFLVGFFSLQLVKKFLNKEKFIYFMWYCLLIGVVLSLFHHI